ncbi:unnamed protein product [Spirodela intermedia]|uniref:Uncharacterized protein n=1 Tax=Spirodela intermedia TaxID=51605 RepID=A0A7I8L2A6_SPIIN|nr:unnamed protein product [Spirodela intermedia]
MPFSSAIIGPRPSVWSSGSRLRSLNLVLRSSISPAALATGSTTPTNEDVAHTILQQKSAAGALQTFRWASRLASFRHDACTYRALIRALVSFRRFDNAKEILAEIPAATGRPPDDDTFIAIVRGLGRAGMSREAVKVADLLTAPAFGIKNPSIKVFNSILNVLVGENIDLARDFYRVKMMGSGVRGDDYTFGILMKGLCRTNRIAEGFKLLILFKSSGLAPNPVIYNTLIHALCRNGKVGRARSLMSEMGCPNDVTFNIMISAYCGEGNYLQAMVMLEKCFDLGYIPDVVAVTKIVDILCNEARFSEAVEILNRVEDKGGVVDVVAYNTLIEGFCRVGKPSVGQRAVKEMEAKGCLPNLRTYNSLISGFCAARDIDSAIDLLGEMKEDQINPDFNTYDTIIRGFCTVGRVDEGYKFLRTMEEQRGELGKRIGPYNSIIYGLYREKRLCEAQEFLEKMGEYFPRSVGRHKKISSLCQKESFEEAMKVYEQMVGEGGTPSVLAYASLIDGLCREKNTREAFNLMNEMIQRGYAPVVSTFNSLIRGFCREGKSMSAVKLLEEMITRGCSPDSGSYTPIIETLCRQENLHKAFHLLDEMAGNDLPPDQTVWETLVNSLSRSPPWMENQRGVHKIMEDVLCQS